MYSVYHVDFCFKVFTLIQNTDSYKGGVTMAEKHLIVLDLDGTLLKDDKTISNKN